MPTWSLFVWLVIGAIAGLIARSFIGGTPPFGRIGDMILGIAGGVVGGYGLALLGVGGGGTVGSAARSTDGAAGPSRGRSYGCPAAMATAAGPGASALIGCSGWAVV